MGQELWVCCNRKKEYTGRIVNYYKKVGVADIKIEARKITVNDNLYIQGPTTGVANFKVNSIELNNKRVKSASKGERICIKTDCIVRKNDKVYRIVNVTTKNKQWYLFEGIYFFKVLYLNLFPLLIGTYFW